NDASAAKLDAVGNAVAGQLTISGSIGTTTVDTVAAVAETAPGAGDAIKGSTAKSIAADINSQTSKTGVTASAQTDLNLNLGAESYSFSIGSDNAKGVTVSFAVGGTASTAADYAAGINAINAQTAKTGVTAQYDSVSKGMKLTNASGENIALTQGTTANNKFEVLGYKADGKIQAAANMVDAKAAGAAATVNGRVTFDSQNSFSVTENTTTGLSIGKATAQGSTLNSVSTLDVTTFDGAQLALKIADAALATVNGQRAQYGALQSRFSSAISNLQSTTENLSASRSRIVDTDFASETANMTRGQILQQAGTAMLAQANSLPNGVLSLLRG
ncbi:MAG: flagellin, partial [Janthinobacterium sp.]